MTTEPAIPTVEERADTIQAQNPGMSRAYALELAVRLPKPNFSGGWWKPAVRKEEKEA